MSERTPRKIARLAAEQGGLCAYCREPFGRFEDEANATLDHVVPQSRGGWSVDANLVAACARCNLAKDRMEASAFIAQIEAGQLRPRRRMVVNDAQRSAIRAQASELQAALQQGRLPKGPPGKQNPPFSKNKPTKRLYTMEDARRWDEERFARQHKAEGPK